MNIAIVMDHIQDIQPHKDTTLAIMIAAQARDWNLFYTTIEGLSLRDGELWLKGYDVTVREDHENWFTLGDLTEIPATHFRTILIRKDPPVDLNYIYATHLLERAEAAGVPVFNKPQSLRDVNEKLFTNWFPQCCAPALIGSQLDDIQGFFEQHQDIIVKPLDLMGGQDVFRLQEWNNEAITIVDRLTNVGTRVISAQPFIPEISEGDKRIILVDGEPIPYALARIPAKDSIRANLAAGGKGEGRELTDRDKWICEQVGETLRQRGLVLVGLDVIGDYLTEINVTSPTCVRELEAQYNIDITGKLLDAINAKL